MNSLHIILFQDKNDPQLRNHDNHSEWLTVKLSCLVNMAKATVIAIAESLA